MPHAALLSVLYIPPGPPAIHFRAYAVESRGFTLIERILTQLQANGLQNASLVLCHDDTDWTLVQPAAAANGVPVFQSQERTQLRALAEVAAAFGPEVIAYFGVEAAFCPPGVMDRALDLHLTEQADYTEVAGLPEGVGPEVVRRDFVIALAAADYAGDPPDIRELVARLSRSDTPLTVRARRLDFPQSPGAPDAIPLLTARDAHRAAEALSCEDPIRGWIEARDYPSAALEAIGEAEPVPDTFRILYVSPASGYSGAGHMLRCLAATMPREGVSQTAVIGLEGVLTGRLREAGCRVLCPNSDISTDRQDNCRLARDVVRFVKPDVVHFNSAPGLPFLTAADEAQVPTVVHMRTAMVDALQPALAAATRIAAVSEFVRGRLLRASIPAEQIVVVYDGVDSEALQRGHFHRAAIRRAIGLADSEFAVLMIARLAEQKRHDVAIEAMALLAEQMPAVRLLLVGDRGSTRLYNRLCERVRTLGLDSRVLWLPFQPDVSSVEAAADALVLPSEDEALGTCVLEAMAMELPVVVADSGGLPEMIENGVTGTVVPPGDPEALSRALSSIRSDPQEFARRASAARAYVREKFAIADHARRMERLLRAAAGKSRTATC